MSMFTEFPPLGPRHLDRAEVIVDGQTYNGFPRTLCHVRKELGVPTELIKYRCTRAPAPDGGIQGYIATHVDIPASLTNPSVKALLEMTIEDSIDEGVQSVARKALRTLLRDAYEPLKETSYRLFPQAENPRLPSSERFTLAQKILSAVQDPCLKATATHLLDQDIYIEFLEQKHRHNRGILMDLQEQLKEEARNQESHHKTIKDLLQGMDRWEKEHQAEITDLRDKARDFGLQNHSLDYRFSNSRGN